MEEGISAEEACRTRSLTPEDFARQCSEDGSIKSSPAAQSDQTRTVTTGGLRETAPPPRDTQWQAALLGTAIVVVVVATWLAWRSKPKP